jgi:hypothetical protein
MAGLPWARLDANIAQHDKILALVHDPSAKRWQALSAYVFAIAWSVGQGTDGRIPAHALGSIHATPAVARLLVKHGLWTEEVAAWRIVNFEHRQQLAVTSEDALAKKKLGAAHGNCKRHHGDTCWRNGRCSRAAS